MSCVDKTTYVRVCIDTNIPRWLVVEVDFEVKILKFWLTIIYKVPQMYVVIFNFTDELLMRGVVTVVAR